MKGRTLCHLPLQRGCLQGQSDRNLGKLIHGDGLQVLDGQMFKLDLEKAEEPEIKLPISAGSSKKQESSRAASTSALLTMPKPFDCVDHNKLWKIVKKMRIPDYLPAS